MTATSAGHNPRRVKRVSLMIAFALCSAIAAPSSGRGQSAADSIARGLDSVSVGARDDAVAQLTELGIVNINAVVRARLISLLENEGTTGFSTNTDSVDTDELFSSYLARLVRLVAQFQDVSSLRGICISTGLDVNNSVRLFVAAHAAQAYPFLEEAWGLSIGRLGLLQTFGQILGSTSGGLSTAQLSTIRAQVYSVAVSNPVGFLAAASYAGLGELAPVAQQIAASDPDAGNRDLAASVASRLSAAQANASSASLLTNSQSWLDAFCLGATGARNGVCHSLHNDFNNAIKHLDGNPNAARNVLNALINRANGATSEGTLSAAEASVVLGNATLVLSRI